MWEQSSQRERGRVMDMDLFDMLFSYGWQMLDHLYHTFEAMLP